MDSILAQEDSDIEVIAVDDGSTDATNKILKAYSRRLRMTIIEPSISHFRRHGY